MRIITLRIQRSLFVYSCFLDCLLHKNGVENDNIRRYVMPTPLTKEPYSHEYVRTNVINHYPYGNKLAAVYTSC